MNRLIRAIKLFFVNPPIFYKKLKRHIFKAKPGDIGVNGIKFNISPGLSPAMSEMYFGCYQYEVTNALKKFLKEGDSFIDIGANVGYISAFALGIVGKTGTVHAFEPVPQYFARLKEIQKNNPGYNLKTNQFALGKQDSTSKIAVSNSKNIGWNTMVKNFMNKDEIKEEIEIKVARLSDYLFERKVHDLSLVKIDTEGFEFPVMKGFHEYLAQAKHLPPIIMEVAPNAYPNLNSSCDELADFMSELGYDSFDIACINQIEVGKLDHTTDVVFIPKNF